MKTTTKTTPMALAILMTTGLVLQSTHAATKAELAAKQQKLSEEALAKMTIKEVAPTNAAIAATFSLQDCSSVSVRDFSRSISSSAAV